jgi:hypothetical protein
MRELLGPLPLFILPFQLETFCSGDTRMVDIDCELGKTSAANVIYQRELVVSSW